MAKGIFVSSPLIRPPIPQRLGDKFRFGALNPGGYALVLHYLAQKVDGPLIFLASDSALAFRLERELVSLDPARSVPIYHFGDRETLIYDQFSPHEDIISQRIRILKQLPTLKRSIVILPLSAIIYYLSPRAFIVDHSFSVKVKDRIDLTQMRQQLQVSGYQCVSQVFSHGEFSIRGSLLDLFPMGSSFPIRIDCFGDEVDNLRTFDPENQRSLEKIEQFNCLPAREYPLNEEDIQRFRRQWRTHFSGNAQKSPIFQEVSQGHPFGGIEYYLPLFFEKMSTIFDYLPENSVVVRTEDTAQHLETLWQQLDTRYDQLGHDILRPILPPSQLCLAQDEFFQCLKAFTHIIFQSNRIEPKAHQWNFEHRPFPGIEIEAHATEPLAQLNQFLKTHSDHRVLFCTESQGRQEALLDLLARIGLRPEKFDDLNQFLARESKMGITVLALEEGIWLSDPSVMLISETQLMGHQVMQRRRRRKASNAPESHFKNFAELTQGALVVHFDHGIGRYQGLVHLKIQDKENEFLMLEYADNNKLYLPVSSLHLISQYSGAQLEQVPLNRLGTDQWDKAKQKAKQKALDVAAELLDIFSRRAAKQGTQIRWSKDDYFQFCQAFPFEETPDQKQAIEQVEQDLKSPQPMDRLICGDVGFGKTEVAMRAAFLVAQHGLQVVMLVPTTLLAQQHFDSFKDRFAKWPFNIEMLSRFKRQKEQSVILEKLEAGQVDIVIGTHKLISQSIQFPKLGLLIIDEEHRFGVRQKEKIKSLKSEVDILTLTATPIPRTLNMALSSIRDLSIIATPPAKRLSIKTFVHEYNLPLIKEAILREIMRGGQVYFLHNSVDTIEKAAHTLDELIPQVQVGVAHGQMPERALEKIMTDFYHHRFNVLVCTTIIETGIDIPSANTIIIERADKLGLAQLHQIRGRVGRSHHQAYAYCLTPNKKSMSKDAIKRLEALESLEDLGAGFTLATHDMEIRGTGELLGQEQSGNIEALGISLFTEILDKAVKSLKNGQKLELTPSQLGPEMEFHSTVLIPEDYLPDVHTRLVLYKRIANSQNHAQLKELKVEMIDRFGLLPEPTLNLFALTALKIKAQPLGIKRIKAASNSGAIEFFEEPNFDPQCIIQLITQQPQHYKLDASGKIRFHFEMPDLETRLTKVDNILDALTNETH